MDLTALSDADFSALQKGDLKGMSDAGFAQLLKAEAAATPLATKIERNRAADAVKYNPAAGMSGPALAAAGAGKAMTDVGRSVQQLMGGIDRADVDEIQRLDRPLMSTTPGKLGYVGGTAAVGLPAMFAPGANTVLGSAAYGGLLGALTPVGTDDDVMRNALFGAGGGAAVTGAVKGASRALAPRVPAGAQTLIDSGVTLTPGQRLGGAAKRIEDAMTAMPIAGDAIKNAQRRTFEEFNAAVANKALKPIGAALPDGVAGREAVAYTEKALGNAYESALARIKAVQQDAVLKTDIGQLSQMVKTSPMPAEVKGQFQKVIKEQLTGKLQGQASMTAETYKQAESEIGRLAAKYAGDASADKQLLGDALQETQAVMRRWLERAAGPEVAGDIKAANAGWAEFKRMQRAATMLGAKDGVFSPENYLSAVKAMDTSKDKGAFARGSALGQDLASDASRVMGGTVPDSGTATRQFMTQPTLLGAGLGIPSAMVTSAAYNKPVQVLMQAILTGKRPALATKAAAELEMASPMLGMLGINASNLYQRGVLK